jgi:hypothetical protein
MKQEWEIVVEEWKKEFQRAEPTLEGLDLTQRDTQFLVSFVRPAGSRSVGRPTLGEVRVAGFPGCCGVMVIHSMLVWPGDGDRIFHGKKHGTRLLHLAEDYARAMGYTLLVASNIKSYSTSQWLPRHGWGVCGQFLNNRTRNTVSVFSKIIDRSKPYHYETLERKETAPASGLGQAQAQPRPEGGPPQPVA